MMVANKYISAVQSKQGTSSYLGNLANLGSQPVYYDLIDCGGAPCACVDANDNPVPNGAPMCQANNTLTQGIFQLPQKVCTSGSLAEAKPLYLANVVSSGLQVSQGSTPICPSSLMAACQSPLASTTLSADTTKPLYPVCTMSSPAGDYYSVPTCPDSSIPKWSNN